MEIYHSSYPILLGMTTETKCSQKIWSGTWCSRWELWQKKTMFWNRLFWRCSKGWHLCTSTATSTETWNQKTFFVWSVLFPKTHALLITTVLSISYFARHYWPVPSVFKVFPRVRTLLRSQTLDSLERSGLVLPTRTTYPRAGIERLRFCSGGKSWTLSFAFLPFCFFPCGRDL